MTISETDNKHEFYIVDFDRTLVDSDKLLEVFIEIADSHYHISKEHIEKIDADIKQRGDTFFLAKYVRDQLAENDQLEVWHELEKQFIHESRALNYMLPGAVELLEWLAARGKRYGILTYGDPLWQRMKLTAAGFKHVRHIILEQKEKGRFISNWQTPEGTFRIPEAFGRGEVDYVVLIDDKAVSFTEFPDGPSKGYWVLDPDHELPSQQGSVPENVVRVANLNELIPKMDH